MWTMRSQRRSARSGLVVAAAAVAATTGLIFLLRSHVPVLSTGVLYLLGVLLVSSIWGLWLGLLTSFASALAFNFCHIPPTGGFTISDPANWLGLAVYLVAAVVVSAIANQARARTEEAELREREAELAAELALLVLGADESALEGAAARIGEAFGVSDVELVEAWVDGSTKQRALPLLVGGDRVGTLLVGRDAATGGLEGLVPALGALMDARRRRTALGEQQIETEALRRSDALKTALLRAVSHDLRSPLTAVRAAAGGVDSPTIDEAQRRELAEVIRTETDRLTGLVQDLLDLSRLESGTAEPRREPCSLEEVVDAAVASAGLHEESIDVRLPEDLPAVLVDAAQIERVVSNLLANAARHGSNGSPIAVTADAAGERVHLRIRDQGSGIGPEDLSRIFEPFYRGGDAHGHGSGLGLAIAKGFAEGNGGRLWAQSRPNEGSTFTVDLQVAR